ncbi:hypothetical protein LCGC14_1198590 [marine sediment metagenome]|uniref:Uncharacterized protein n=1 Tax=marine sediment metagenome TaxID=412755 RepID=A0A0F9LM26_9ZZZZ
MTKSQSFKFDIKPSFFLGEPADSQNLFLRNEPNLSNQKFTTNPCGIDGYNAFQRITKNGTNPNEANFSPLHRRGFPLLSRRIHAFLKILFLGSKPNFPTQRITATTCSGNTYNDFYPQTNKKSKPNPNPIQTQNKPNFGEKANFPTLSPNP